MPTSTVPVAIQIPRSLATFIADCVVEEKHEDSIVMTDHPVEQGSTITDHAYRLPATVTLTYAWSMGSSQNTTLSYSFLQDLYTQLLQLQRSVTPFAVYTGKRVYSNMLLQSLAVDTDAKTENLLLVRATCRELLMAVTTVLSLAPASQQSQPQKTSPVQPSGSLNLLPGQNYDPNNGAVTGNNGFGSSGYGSEGYGV